MSKMIFNDPTVMNLVVQSLLGTDIPANSYAVTSNELHSKSINIRVTAKFLVFLIVQHWWALWLKSIGEVSANLLLVIHWNIHLQRKVVQYYAYYRFFEALILMGVAVTSGSENLQIREDEKRRKNK
ncbi:hypothetical protein BDF21DRAFT_403554 [Thamnidium elegans]|nr:hypothetical protein BDF21DRAFT_403554 [Thamnidium elegans]